MTFLSNGKIFLGSVLVFSLAKFFQVEAENPGSLLVKTGETLTIDTSSLVANVGLKNIPMSSYTGEVLRDNQTLRYHVAVLKYENDIVLDSGSTLIIKGNRSLSIQSEKGNIDIRTDLNMTCTDIALNQSCLGGYSVQGHPIGKNIYRGDGPGWKKCRSDLIADLIQFCVPGAAHAGFGEIRNGINGERTKNDFSAIYGKHNFTSMLGGSGGFLFNNRTGVFYGGGAFEFIARKGAITINASISAAAVNELYEGSLFSGSSGGLIRLIAKKVEMTPKSSLSVNASSGSNLKFHGKENGGGSGGVIQIDASEGTVYNLALAGGQSKCHDKYDIQPPQDGYFVIKGFHNISKSRIGLYQWPNESKSTINTTKDDLVKISHDITLIKEKFKTIISPDKLSSLILNNLRRLTNFSLAHNMTKRHLRTFVQIFENYTEIIENMMAFNMSSHIKDVYQLLLKLADVVMATTNQQNWKDLEKLPYFIGLLEKIAVSISLNFTLDYHSDTIITQSYALVDGGNEEGFEFPVYSKLPSNSFINARQDFVRIPKLSLTHPPGEYKFVIFVFKDIQNGLPKSTQSLEVASFLMSCSLLYKGLPVTKLASPALLHFALKKEETNMTARCSFLDTKNNSWDDEGVSLEELQPTKTICKTTHFTSFAVLMQHTNIELTKTEELSLQLITYIGCGISTGTLLLALIVFLSIEGLTSDRHRIHLNLVLSLLLAQILFLTGITATDHEILCKIIAGSLHYFFMVSFMWMLIEGVHLYMKVVRVFGIENIKFRQYLIVGWGVPALIVGAAAIIKPLGYGTKYVCWLSLNDGFVWAFIGPAAAIIAINCVILVVVVKTVVASASTMRSSEHSHIKAGVKGALVLMPLMGITWIFGLLAVNRGTLVFQYLFSISNSLQGVLIFLLHIVMNSEVRLAFKRQREKRQLSKESADYNASVSYSNGSNRKTWGKESSLSSDNTLKTGLGKLKARISLNIVPRTSRVVSVKPMENMDDEVKVKRKYHNKSPSSGISSFPKERDMEPMPPHHSPLRSDFKRS